MKRWLLNLLTSAILFSAPLAAHAQTIELQAISDFSNRESGAVPYYLDIAGNRNSLAINAADPNYRNKFARAEHEFIGADGIYDITINALGEIDGDGTYRLLINGIVQGASVNTPVTTDYTIVKHTFKGIALTAPTIIGIESNAVSNNMIPEGDGYAFARGRWQSVTLEAIPLETNSGASVDLALSLSTVDELVKQNATAPIVASVVNNSNTTMATAPVVSFALPDTIGFNNSESCTTYRGEVLCALAELAPGEMSNVSFEADINAVGWLSVSASVKSDQVDSDRTNNFALLSFESTEEALEPTYTPAPTNTPTPTTASLNPTTSNDESDSGAWGWPTSLLILLVGALRIQMRRRTQISLRT